MKRILFVNHVGEKCGVYQHGVRFFESIKKIPDYSVDYLDCSNLKDLENTISAVQPHIIIYNYHTITLPFVDKNFVNQIKGSIHICLAHELPQADIDKIDGTFFDYYLFQNPAFVESNSRVFKLNRLLPQYKKNYPEPEIVTVGSYGFDSGVKGYGDLIRLVENEFDQATIRLNIAPHSTYDPYGTRSQQIDENLKRIPKKPGIRLEISHEFFSNDRLLDFLAQNSINVFLYDPFELEAMRGGISSAIDQAISVKKPIAITNNLLFRHLFHINPSIIVNYKNYKKIYKNIKWIIKITIKTILYFNFKDWRLAKQTFQNVFKAIPKTCSVLLRFRKLQLHSLKTILKNGTQPLEPLYSEWSEERFQKNFIQILNHILSLSSEKSERMEITHHKR
jgi:hypothetical protein